MAFCTYALNLSDPGVAGLLVARALLREAGVWVVACVGHGCGFYREEQRNNLFEVDLRVMIWIRMDLISREFGAVGDGLRFLGIVEAF